MEWDDGVEVEIRTAKDNSRPGNGYPQMAEQAAILYKEGIASCILPSGRYSVTLGKFVGVQAKSDKYYEDYHTEWDFLKDVLVKMQNIPEWLQTVTKYL